MLSIVSSYLNISRLTNAISLIKTADAVLEGDAQRWGGQLIMVLPELNTVDVFTGGNYVAKRPDFKILEEFVIPAFD